MFLKERFGPVAIVGARVPRIFTYENVLDSLHTMKQPGYFNAIRQMLLPNTRIEIIASDYHASVFVLGVVDGILCLYKHDIKCRRDEAILPKQATPKAPQPIKSKSSAKAKKGKAA